MKKVSSNKDYEIVVFSDDWFGLPFSCKHLLKNFLSDTPIIWVETIGLRSPKINIYDIKRAFQKILGWLFNQKDSESKLVPQNLQIIDPFQIPYNHLPFIRKINIKKMISSVNAITQKAKSKKRVMLTTWPFLGDLMGCIGEDLCIYYRVDDFSEFPGVRRAHTINLENEVIEKADIIIASAENLIPEKHENKAKYLPHGVDFDHFAKNVQRGAIPHLIKETPSPIIGFFGLLNSWLDFDLILNIAKRRPDWSFLFLGPSQMPDSDLPKADNIYFPGPVNYKELPQYAANFDIALIPFKINKLTISVNPLKLMEYFAIGMPVVTTPLPEVTKYKECVYVGADETSFEKAIESALNETDSTVRDKRKKLAKERSWKAKSNDLRKWIEDALEKKVG